MNNVKYLIEKAREADQLADEVDDTEAQIDWTMVAVFWLGLAERAMKGTSDKRRPPLGGLVMH